MEHLNKILLVCGMLMIFAGCGVKGRPLPPLNPAPLGRGEPTYKESAKKPLPKVLRQDQEEAPANESEER
ncbi:MAG: hypothetical protein OM95_08810 [Bdellovibrio sp. ArHS]|uniref:hypothetical protein n=1 Tax=Bdellovibrio sp. ArHS TaxID=1569284 RepID=UPI000583843D|nr:hypothetical protein [Bdellovibrio sp. ArHS]KHD88590.1 MAG: hypothetical protein OM95_08810 [Bdellovibrio sp. ArHS]